MEKHKQGTVSLLLATKYFIEEEYTVSLPLVDFGEYDLIIDNGSLKRIQVKTIYWDNCKQRHLISCVTSHRKGNNRILNKKYSLTSFDYLCGVEKTTMSIYLIPIKKIYGRRSITVYPNGKPNTVNSRYKDFESYKMKQTYCAVDA